MTTPEIVDVLIIGGGPAGQAAAVSIARNVHTAVLFDSHEYRNERSNQMHMVPTLDGTNPSIFRDVARKNTSERYELISFVDTKILSAKKSGELFTVIDDTGASWTGRGLVLATGVTDVMLDIPGFAECWGRSMYVSISSCF
jgi:thioredoxin reductase